MSGGLLVRNSSIANINGTYNDYNVASGLNRIWLSVDKVTVIRYVDTNEFIYTLTTDAIVSVNKQYFVKTASGFEEVTAPAFNSQIYAGMYYERKLKKGWVVQHCSQSSIDQSLVYADVVALAITDSITSSPYDTTLEWKDVDDNIVDIAITRWDESSIVTTTSDPIIDNAAGTITTVTTMTNIITGDVYRETNVVHTKTVYNTKDLIRYDNINLTLGKVYRFQFVSDFASIGYQPNLKQQDINAGIYIVDKILNYHDMVTGGIDLYANLYQPLGITKEVYTNDLNRIQDSSIYRLVDPTDKSKVYYMPQTFIVGTPDASVDEYNKVLLTINLGIHGDVTLINDISSTISKVLEKMWGIDATQDPAQISVYDKIWLARSQKEELDKERINRRETSTVDFSNLFNLVETNIFYRENLRLKSKLKAYEELLIKQKSK